MTERIIGDCRLILGDCRDVLPVECDAVVTDPPYGIGAGHMSFGMWTTSRMDDESWDDERPNLAPVLDMQVPTVIWGGNYHDLPRSRMFLVWDKGNGFYGRDFAECEQAWCSMDGNARVFHYDPLARRDYHNGGKVHPTQKPVPLMQWCLSFVNGVVCDPYMGSGSTGCACALLGRSFIGVERDARYFDIARRRIEAAYSDQALFAGASK